MIITIMTHFYPEGRDYNATQNIWFDGELECSYAEKLSGPEAAYGWHQAQEKNQNDWKEL